MFQFLNGTIKRPTETSIKVGGWRFNSSMVQLKDVLSKEGIYRSGEFQFLNGTIKSDISSFAQYQSVLFQFLNGTIKSYLFFF